MKVPATSLSPLPGVEAGAAGTSADGFAAMLAAVLAVPSDPAALPVIESPVSTGRPETGENEGESTESDTPAPEPSVASPGPASAEAVPVAVPAESGGTAPTPPAAAFKAGDALPEVHAAPTAASAPPSPDIKLPVQPAAVPIEAASTAETRPNPEPILGRGGPVAIEPAAPQQAAAPVPGGASDHGEDGAEPMPLTQRADPAGTEATAPEPWSTPRESATTQPIATVAPAAAPAALDTAVSARPAPPPAPPAMEQLHPVITRLATSGGDGVHRLTVRLHPEELGPVQITVVVRDGAVQVSLTALDDAQAVLQSGTPELRRMLEEAGLPGVDVDVQGGFGGGDREQRTESPVSGGPGGGMDPAADVSDPRSRRSTEPGVVDLRL